MEHEFLVVGGFGDVGKRKEQLNECDYVIIGGGGLVPMTHSIVSMFANNIIS